MNLTTSRSDALQQLIDQNAIIIQQNQELAKLNKGVLQYLSGQTNSASPMMFLDNYTGVVQNALEGGNPMAYKRERVRVGTDADGKPIYIQVSGDNQDERNDAIVRAILGSTRRAEFITEAPVIVQAMPEVQPKELHPLDKVAWDWFNNYLPLKIKSGVMRVSQLSPIKSHMTAHIIRYFGDTPVESIEHKDIQSFLNAQVNPKTEEYYAKMVIEQRKGCLHQILEYSVVNGYIEQNPMDKGKLINPSNKKETREPLSKEELIYVRSMIPMLRTERERLYVTMLAYLPYRRCEALGQRWEDIDFDNNLCKVTGGVVEENGIAVYYEGHAKTISSIRSMVATDAMMDALRPYRKDVGFLLNTNGAHLKVSEINNLWNGIKTQIPMLDKKGITPYCFRHTMATRMYHETNDLISVAKQCGHSSTATTARVYVHDDIEHRRETVEKMERALC